MNTEQELFYLTLTVGETIDFATRMKTPKTTAPGFASAEESRVGSRDFLLKLLGIQHTFNTKVGNELIRGVSGGERKRVSIVEAMARGAASIAGTIPQVASTPAPHVSALLVTKCYLSLIILLLYLDSVIPNIEQRVFFVLVLVLFAPR